MRTEGLGRKSLVREEDWIKERLDKHEGEIKAVRNLRKRKSGASKNMQSRNPQICNEQ